MRQIKNGRPTLILTLIIAIASLALAACSSTPAAPVPQSTVPPAVLSAAAAPQPTVQPPAPAAVAAPAQPPAPETKAATAKKAATLGERLEALKAARRNVVPLPDPEPVVIPRDLEARVDEYANAALKRGRFSGSILIARGDEVLLSKGYGMADYEKGVPNTSQTKFAIGRITRQFTAMAIMQLQEKGLLLVDDPISKFLPDYPGGDQIAIYHLMITAAGITPYALLPGFQEASASPSSVAELIATFRDEPLDFEPGQSISDGGSGYVLLGAIIEKLSGMSYEAYVQKNIFEPLGMSDSGYDINRPGVSQRAYGYLRLGDEPIRETPIDTTNAYSAMGLYSTVEDLYKWTRAVRHEKLVGRGSVGDIFTVYYETGAGMQVGYGWLMAKRDTSFLSPAGSGRDRTGQVGSAIGSFTGTNLLLTNDDIIIVELNNLTTTRPSDVIVDLFALVTGIPYEIPAFPDEKELDAAKLDRYVGRYKEIFRDNITTTHNLEFSNLGANRPFITVTNENGGLFVEFEGSPYPKTQLFPETTIRWFARSTDLGITFAKSDLAGVTGLLVRHNDEEKFRYKLETGK